MQTKLTVLFVLAHSRIDTRITNIKFNNVLQKVFEISYFILFYLFFNLFFFFLNFYFLEP